MGPHARSSQSSAAVTRRLWPRIARLGKFETRLISNPTPTAPVMHVGCDGMQRRLDDLAIHGSKSVVSEFGAGVRMSSGSSAEPRPTMRDFFPLASSAPSSLEDRVTTRRQCSRQSRTMPSKAQTETQSKVGQVQTQSPDTRVITKITRQAVKLGKKPGKRR